MNKYNHTDIVGLDKLWVVTTVSNPQRYKSRYELYNRFKAAIESVGVNLLTVELALGDRSFEVTEAGNPNHVQLRTTQEIWSKENCLNIGVSRLPSDWMYVVFMDADVVIARPDWKQELVHQLQHYDVIQCFQTAIDLGPEGEALRVNNGFVWSWQNNLGVLSKNNYQAWHPGFAWAFTKKAFTDLGGLIDFAILGAGDRHMAMGLIGKVEQTTDTRLSAGYKESLEIWQDRATTHIRQNIGYMPGTIYHYWHGSKKNRFYSERWKILLKHNYDPEFDIKKDWQGLNVLTDKGLRMRIDLRNYFRSRNEDGTEL